MNSALLVFLMFLRLNQLSLIHCYLVQFAIVFERDFDATKCSDCVNEQQVQWTVALSPLLQNLERHDGVSLFCSYQRIWGNLTQMIYLIFIA